MAASIFNDKFSEPTTQMLSDVIDEAEEYFEAIKTFISDNYGGLTTVWKFYGIKAGWILKLLSKKRNVLFIVPGEKFFEVVFTLGDKAVEEALAAQLSDGIKKNLKETTKYAEGRSIRIEVRSKNDLENIIKLIGIKMLN
mgnify:CR=1 FL=1